ncbi:Sec-independent protein translocase TatB [Arthrobacter pityocampae]|uniref:Sec-independent protein translocase TatB n=1 Tax=Arthrobacter pityocampae TaxID=547334 RepID=A0A2S5J200_9MICC|nr:Sec-independent protein translocase TatB [Arthrobacter pityocampae]PPB50859.1 Sec-independent protein translocase TatB [Arthrobacter pityocampae]
MLGINGLELVVLVLIAVMVLGPERLPEYAAQLARLVKGLRRMATGAREQLREEVGPELDEVDWRKLDPRQYDPRRIIKEALLDDVEDAFKPVNSGAPRPVAPAVAPAAVRPALSVPVGPRLSAGQSAPYDLEAT